MTVPSPKSKCLGKTAEKYSSYCSTECPLTALCVMLAMGVYLRKDYKVPPYHDTPDNT